MTYSWKASSESPVSDISLIILTVAFQLNYIGFVILVLKSVNKGTTGLFFAGHVRRFHV